MRKWLARLVLGTVFLLATSGAVTSAQIQIPPAPTGNGLYVQDNAGVLAAATKHKINRLGAAIAEKTTAQLVVVTVNTLDGQPIEEYSRELLRRWGIGDKTANNGMLVLISVQERKARIEVGYGLEGALPDAKAGAVLDDAMMPYFRQGDYDRGVLTGYSALASIVAKEYNVDLARAPPNVTAKKGGGLNELWRGFPWWLQLLSITGAFILIAIDWAFLGGRLTFLALALLNSRGRGSRGGFGGGSGGGGGAGRGW
ncbi:TPM domain-containing protein [Anaeroselena agilis]|uniref:TPM domain-containing protein n=1 Tax=Anaeroselena agilis TaxID=3063788 RepID=A0ABU3NS59_9FIRM|nr:TPM domain-containing protein [Selenomonadales bacterium 4137-cl]